MFAGTQNKSIVRRMLGKLTLALFATATATAFAAPAQAEDLTLWSWRQEDKAAYAKFIAAFRKQHPDINVKFEAFEAANYNTVLSTALAYIIFFRILDSAGPSNLLLVTFLIPVSAILLASLFLGERLAWTHFAGMGLIGLGLAAIDGRLWRAVRG